MRADEPRELGVGLGNDEFDIEYMNARTPSHGNDIGGGADKNVAGLGATKQRDGGEAPVAMLCAVREAQKKEGLRPPLRIGNGGRLVDSHALLGGVDYGVGAAVFQVDLGGGYLNLIHVCVEAERGANPPLALAGELEDVRNPYNDLPVGRNHVETGILGRLRRRRERNRRIRTHLRGKAVQVEFRWPGTAVHDD